MPLFQSTEDRVYPSIITAMIMCTYEYVLLAI